MDDQSPQAQNLLANRYLLVKELGRGGVGVVYLARDEQLLSRPVVIKVLLEEAFQDQWVKTKFRQEMEALSRISHPGVVGLLDAGETNEGKPFIAMQFIDGVTLRSLMKPEGMDLAQTAYLIRQIGDALSAAHDKGVLHRDLKPENIMLETTSSGEQQVKLIDFGLAKVRNSRIAESTALPNVAGTFSYMAPEQLLSRPSGVAADVFSLGAICFEMLTGRKPFNPESAFELLEMQKKGMELKPGQLRPALSEATQAILMKALSFEPKDRFTGVKDFSDQLARSLTTEVQTLSPTATKPVSKRKATSLMTGLSWILALTLLVLFFKVAFFRFISWQSYTSRLLILIPVFIGAFVMTLLARANPKLLSTRVGLAMSCLIGIALLLTRPVVTISAVPGKINSTPADRFTLSYSDPKGYHYTTVDSHYCSISINPGWWNELSDYSLALSLSSDIEFADVYFEKDFGNSEQLSLQPSNERDILILKKTLDHFDHARAVRFTYKYRNPPKESTAFVSVKSGDTDFSYDAKLPL